MIFFQIDFSDRSTQICQINKLVKKKKNYTGSYGKFKRGSVSVTHRVILCKPKFICQTNRQENKNSNMWF